MTQDKLVAIHSFPVWLPQTQTWMYNQVKYLPDNIRSHVVCEYTQNLEQFAVPNIHSLKDASRLRFYWEKSLRKLHIKNHLDFPISIARKINARILHSHFGYIGWANLEVAKQIGMKHVVTFYGEDVNRLPVQDSRWHARYQTLFAQADQFLCEGPHMAECLQKLACPPAKIRVQHLGVAVETIPYHPRRWNPDEPLRVLIASSFREKKGIPYALEALAKIQFDVPLEITLIGDASPDVSSQREKQRIVEIVEKSGLRSRIKLLGFQPYPVLFQEAYRNHIFILPSVTASDGDTEGGAPVVLIEMIATGMPVISTSHCDIPSVVQYGMDDWLVNERDVAAITERIRWLIEHPMEWPNLLATGRKHVEMEFDAVQQGERLGKLYRELVQDEQDKEM